MIYLPARGHMPTAFDKIIDRVAQNVFQSKRLTGTGIMFVGLDQKGNVKYEMIHPRDFYRLPD